MFFFIMAPLLSYHWRMVIAAVIPALILMWKVYKSDRLEKESPRLLWKLVLMGVLSTVIALVLEWILQALLGLIVPESHPLYNVLLYFVVVGMVEECSKYFVLKRSTWKLHEFNCQYDGVVYAVFVSLGFALFENIGYVLRFGFSAAIIRALTAIPGHACFGVFMGVFYGLARGYAYLGERGRSKLMRMLAVIIPTFIHGTYDYIATIGTGSGEIFFIIFVMILFILSFILINRMSKNDHYFQIDRYQYFPF